MRLRVDERREEKDGMETSVGEGKFLMLVHPLFSLCTSRGVGAIPIDVDISAHSSPLLLSLTRSASRRRIVLPRILLRVFLQHR